MHANSSFGSVQLVNGTQPFNGSGYGVSLGGIQL